MPADDGSDGREHPERDPLRGAVGVAGIVVGLGWAVALGSRGLTPATPMELLPPLALVFVGVVFTRRHLGTGSESPGS